MRFIDRLFEVFVILPAQALFEVMHERERKAFLHQLMSRGWTLEEAQEEWHIYSL